MVLVATIRRDGSPRVSPVEPLLWGGDLWLSMGLGSRKAADLRRDARVLVHSIVTHRSGEDGEYKLRGIAAEEPDQAVQARYARAVAERLGWEPESGKFHLFRVDVADIAFVRWDGKTSDQYVARWPAGIEFVRRGTSATRTCRTTRRVPPVVPEGETAKAAAETYIGPCGPDHGRRRPLAYDAEPVTIRCAIART